MKLAVLKKALGDIRGELSDFEPSLISSSDAARAFVVLTELEKTISGALTFVTARATEARDWEKKKDTRAPPPGWPRRWDRASARAPP